MPMCNRAGRFHARIGEIGVSEQGDNNLACVIARYQIYEEMSTEIYDVSGEQLEITGFHYLEKKDGNLNERIINDLKQAFGWDGRDPFWFEQQAVDQLPPIQIVTEMDEYQGKVRCRIAWLNPYGSDNSGMAIPHADDSSKRNIASRLGGKLRALNGGTPANAPMPARPKQAAESAPTATMEEAWEKFGNAGIAAGAPDDQIEAAWFAAIARFGKTTETMTPEEWAKLAAGGFLPVKKAAPARKAPAAAGAASNAGATDAETPSAADDLQF